MRYKKKICSVEEPTEYMVHHIVFLKLRDDLPPKQKRAISMAIIEELPKKIPAIQKVSYGKYSSPENLNQGYTHAFIMIFKNKKDRNHYLKHPEHLRIALEIITPSLKKERIPVIAFDYESA